MKIKTKLYLGLGLLFLLILLLTGVGVRYISSMSNASKSILLANYQTLEYSKQMLISLDEKENLKNSIQKFEENLQKQNSNISEIGEKELTESLNQHFQILKENPWEENIRVSIRKDLYEIMSLNMNAIMRKSIIAEKISHDATVWIALAGTLCFLISLSLLISFPGSIANPIKELTGSIKEIAKQNYSERLHFESGDEFGDLASSFNTMAAKLEEYANSNLSKLLFEKKRIDTLINNMHDPIIGLDEEKKILFANEEATKILGIEKHNLIGKPAQDIALTNDLMRSLTKDLMLPGDKYEKTKKPPLKIYANNKESYFEQEFLDILTTPTGEEKSKLIGHVIILQNVTPFKELDLAKTNFIATVSHELKTPISSILLSLKLIEDQRVGEMNIEQKQLIKNVREDSERLLKITGELLKMTQIETGKIQLTLQQTDIKEIIHYAVEANKTQAEQNNITLQINSSDDLPKVNADAEKTAWVLTNLISNALRYSHENSKVIVSAKQKDKQIIIEVQDFGKGIDTKYKDKIFDRYFRIPGTTKEGTGLGLAISKEFIEAQGGKIWVETETGVGSKFSFELNS